MIPPHKTPVYLDYNATTPCDPEVVKEMLPYFSGNFGNAASLSSYHGFKAHQAVEKSRDRIAALLGAESSEIIFTSGATESNNLALRSVYSALSEQGNHIISSSIEHPAVLATLKDLEKQGVRVSLIPPLPNGSFDIEAMRALISPETILICVMYANNETGVINPIEEISAVARQHQILLMSDATQAIGKLPINLQKIPVDILTGSAHKIYGPKGVGLFYLRHRHGKKVIDIQPQITGGHGEQGMRGGTLNVTGIVGFGKAAELAAQELEQGLTTTARQRDRLENALLALGHIQVNGAGSQRLAHVSNLSFRHVDGGKLLKLLKNTLTISTGSACTSSSLSPSHVLTALGLSDELAQSTLRFSLGRDTTEEEIDFAIAEVRRVTKLIEDVSVDHPA